MIIDKTVDININNYCIKHYKDLGYVVKEHDVISVPIEHLLPTSHHIINVKCDICGKEKKLQYRRYLLSFNNGGYYCCSNCQKIKMDKTVKHIYGFDNVFQNDEIKEKIKKTNTERYGNESFLRSSFKKFVKETYNKEDIKFSDFTEKTVSDYDTYLRKKCCINTTNDYKKRIESEPKEVRSGLTKN